MPLHMRALRDPPPSPAPCRNASPPPWSPFSLLLREFLLSSSGVAPQVGPPNFPLSPRPSPIFLDAGASGPTSQLSGRGSTRARVRFGGCICRGEGLGGIGLRLWSHLRAPRPSRSPSSSRLCLQSPNPGGLQIPVGAPTPRDGAFALCTPSAHAPETRNSFPRACPYRAPAPALPTPAHSPPLPTSLIPGSSGRPEQRPDAARTPIRTSSAFLPTFSLLSPPFSRPSALATGRGPSRLALGERASAPTAPACHIAGSSSSSTMSWRVAARLGTAPARRPGNRGASNPRP